MGCPWQFHCPDKMREQHDNYGDHHLLTLPLLAVPQMSSRSGSHIGNRETIMKVDRVVMVILLSTFIITILSIPSISQESHCQSRYFSKSENNKQSLLLVFVHGILGDCTTTWTNKRVDTYWPEMAGKDPFLKGAHVYVYYYPSSPLNPSPSIGQILSDMNQKFWSDDVTKHYQQIAFIAHSFGGLIVRAHLKERLDSNLTTRRYPTVRFLYLLGTPHEEVKNAIARIIGALGENNQIRDVTGVNSSVPSLISDWENSEVLSTVPVYCGYEMRSTGPFGIIVGPHSAKRLCSKARHFNTDHPGLAKPNDPTADQHGYLQMMFEETSKDWWERILPWR